MVSRILAEANRLAYYGFKDPGRRHKTPGSGTEYFITHGTAGSMCFVFFWFLLPTVSHGNNVE